MNLESHPLRLRLCPLVVLAMVSVGSATLAQPPVVTSGAIFDDFAADWKMGQALAAQGRRVLFSGSSTSTETWFVRRDPGDVWSVWTRYGADAVDVEDQAVAAANSTGVEYVLWVDGGTPDFADANEVSEPVCGPALAIEAGRIVVGCASDNGDRGVAKVLNLFAVEKVENGTEVGGRLGAAVAFDGNTVAIGEPRDLSGLAGRVHILRDIGGTWSDAGTLEQPSGGENGNAFGAALALSGSWLAVGAPLDDTSLPDPIAGTDVGTVHLFRKTGILGVFAYQTTLYGEASGDHFGAALAMTANTLVIGAPGVNGPSMFVDIGRAYVYWRAGNQWTWAARVGASGPLLGDRFGTSVGILDEGVVVGAPGHTGTNSNSGGIYFFPGIVPLFLDGFESGDLSLWSASAP